MRVTISGTASPEVMSDMWLLIKVIVSQNWCFSTQLQICEFEVNIKIPRMNKTKNS